LQGWSRVWAPDVVQDGTEGPALDRSQGWSRGRTPDVAEGWTRDRLRAVVQGWSRVWAPDVVQDGTEGPALDRSQGWSRGRSSDVVRGRPPCRAQDRAPSRPQGPSHVRVKEVAA
ncbi:hypothetical protein ACFYZ2_19290, partial [Streptomyces sviceus]|uniref:hypothetical protein n=1 Tax=Streptomyces sviceus TaxID=285530 RepID=UPI00368ECBED